MQPHAAKVPAQGSLYPGSVTEVQRMSRRTQYRPDGSITRDGRHPGRPERSLEMGTAPCLVWPCAAALQHRL